MKLIGTDVYGKKHDLDSGQLEWRPSIYGIIINDGKVLLSRQFKTRFDLPGGEIELGETFEEAVVREVKEETGLNVKAIKLIGATSNIFVPSHSPSFKGKSFHSILIYFLCEFVGGEMSTGGFKGDEKLYVEMAEWVPLSELDNIDPASTVDFRRFILQAAKEAK